MTKPVIKNVKQVKKDFSVIKSKLVQDDNYIKQDGKLKLKVQVYSNIRQKWLTATSEEVVRQEYILFLLNDLSLSVQQLAEEIIVTGLGGGKARADIIIWQSIKDKQVGAIPLAVVECKAENAVLNDVVQQQGNNYAQYTKAQYLIITNGKQTRAFELLHDKMLCTQIEISYQKFLHLFTTSKSNAVKTADQTTFMPYNRAENDVVAASVEAGLIGFGENYIAPKALVYKILKVFAEQMGRKPLSDMKMTEKLNNLSKNTLQQVQKKLPSGRREYVWKGLGISEDALLQLKITKEVVVDGGSGVVQLNMLEYYKEMTGEPSYPYSS